MTSSYLSVWLKLTVNIFLSKIINPEAQNPGGGRAEATCYGITIQAIEGAFTLKLGILQLSSNICESWNCFYQDQSLNLQEFPDVFKYFSNNKKELVKINQYWLRCSVLSLTHPSTQIIIVIHKKDIFHISPDYYLEFKSQSSNSMNLLHF